VFDELGQLWRSMCRINKSMLSAVYRWEPKGMSIL